MAPQDSLVLGREICVEFGLKLSAIETESRASREPARPNAAIASECVGWRLRLRPRDQWNPKRYGLTQPRDGRAGI